MQLSWNLIARGICKQNDEKQNVIQYDLFNTLWYENAKNQKGNFEEANACKKTGFHMMLFIINQPILSQVNCFEKYRFFNIIQYHTSATASGGASHQEACTQNSERIPFEAGPMVDWTNPGTNAILVSKDLWLKQW